MHHKGVSLTPLRLCPRATGQQSRQAHYGLHRTQLSALFPMHALPFCKNAWCTKRIPQSPNIKVKQLENRKFRRTTRGAWLNNLKFFLHSRFSAKAYSKSLSKSRHQYKMTSHKMRQKLTCGQKILLKLSKTARILWKFVS